jgi:hypothetical protein
MIPGDARVFRLSELEQAKTWGPIPALQRWVPIVVIAVILAGALIALRRSVSEEFPPQGGAFAPG